jgi:hypothetical protein
MFSSTTMALSTNMPTAKEMPARLTTLRVRSKIHRKIKVPTAEMGMATTVVKVEEMLLRKSRSTTRASNPPMTTLRLTRSMALPI